MTTSLDYKMTEILYELLINTNLYNYDNDERLVKPCVCSYTNEKGQGVVQLIFNNGEKCYITLTSEEIKHDYDITLLYPNGTMGAINNIISLGASVNAVELKEQLIRCGLNVDRVLDMLYTLGDNLIYSNWILECESDTHILISGKDKLDNKIYIKIKEI